MDHFLKVFIWICYNIASVFSRFCHKACETLVPWLRLPCPSSDPGVCSNSCPSHGWCHPTISSSGIPFSSCLQCFPVSGSFPMSQFFASWGQSISFSFSISPSNEYLGLISFRMDWTGWISLQSKGLSRVFSNTTVQKHQFFGAQLSSQSNSHISIQFHWHFFFSMSIGNG